MVSPTPDARPHFCGSAIVEPVSACRSLRFRETGFRGQRIRCPNRFLSRNQPLAETKCSRQTPPIGRLFGESPEILVRVGRRGGGSSPIRTGLPAIFKMQGDSAEMQGGARARAGQKATFTMGCRIASLLREQGDLSLPAGTSREGGEKLTNQGMTVA